MDWRRVLGPRHRAHGSGPTWSDPPADVVEFASRLDAAGLGKQRDALVSLARESVRLEPVGRLPATSTTRLGGRPDLPASTPWPRRGGVPLSFLLQVDLAEAGSHVSGLPEDGLLSFFYEAVTQDAWGFDPEDRGSWSVLHTPADAAPEPRSFPDDLAEDGRFRALPMTSAPETTFPPWESHDAAAAGAADSTAYADVLGEGDDEDEETPRHRVLGHPDPIQGDMQAECQLASNGVYCGDASGYRGARSRELLRDAGRWRLLAQIDSTEDETGMMWGDSGRVYFWITEQSLRERRWEDVWVVVQCY